MEKDASEYAQSQIDGYLAMLRRNRTVIILTLYGGHLPDSLRTRPVRVMREIIANPPQTFLFDES